MNEGELQVNFLIKASSVLSRIQNNEAQNVLRSLYLLRCNQLTGSFRLPQKQFSHEARCPHCLIEWTKETEIRVTPIKLSKRQRRRIRSNGKLKKNSVNKEYLLHSNSMDKVCKFCGHTTSTVVIKPNDTLKPSKEEKSCMKYSKVPDTKQIVKVTKQTMKSIKVPTQKISKMNVYSNSKEVFSLSQQNNTLCSFIKQAPKIIKNNKKKKDKFAGLCRTAVIAASKLKQEKDKQNKLSLFLKPST